MYSKLKHRVILNLIMHRIIEILYYNNRQYEFNPTGPKMTLLHSTLSKHNF